MSCLCRNPKRGHYRPGSDGSLKYPACHIEVVTGDDLPKIVRQTEPLIEKYGDDQKEDALKRA